MLLFNVVLVAIFVWARKGALIVMRPHMSRKSCRSVEGLCAVGPGALDGLVVGWKFAGGGRASRKGRHGGGRGMD